MANIPFHSSFLVTTSSGDVYEVNKNTLEATYKLTIQSTEDVTDIALAKDGSLYAVTSSGLYQVNTRTGSMSQLATSSSYANALVVTDDNMAWIGFADYAALASFDLDTNLVGASFASGYSDGDIVMVDDDLALATTASDIKVYGSSGTLVDDGPYHGLSAVYSLHYDAKADVMWGVTASGRVYSEIDTGPNFMGLLDIPGSDAINGAASLPTKKIVGSNGDDRIDVLLSRAVVLGRGGDDRITGDQGNNKLKGGRGDDLIEGGGGKDKIKGGAGKDTVVGDNGDDALYGQNGRDTFVFDRNDSKGRDVIRDFESGRDTFEITSGATKYADLDFSEVNRGLVVSWASTDVLLKGFDLGDISRSDFDFV